MEAKTFCLVAGVIFAVVALFHLVRIGMDWSVSRDVLAGVDRLEHGRDLTNQHQLSIHIAC
jgi:hypothetical protein